MELVQGRATAEGESVVQEAIGENLDQRTADDEILFDLNVLRPGRPRAPLQNVVARNHKSISTSAFT